MRNYSAAHVVSKGTANWFAPEGLDKYCRRIDHRCVIPFDMDVLGGAHAVLLWLKRARSYVIYSENKFFCGGTVAQSEGDSQSASEDIITWELGGNKWRSGLGDLYELWMHAIR